MPGRWGCQRASRAIAALLLVSLSCASQVSAGLRGLDPAQESLYSQAQTSGTYRCLDGSKSVPASALNDNYCDCPDGSDEPG